MAAQGARSVPLTFGQGAERQAVTRRLEEIEKSFDEGGLDGVNTGDVAWLIAAVRWFKDGN